MKDIKFKTVTFQNRKKQLTVVYTSGKRLILHYGSLGIRKNIHEAWVDRETGARSVGLRYEDGSEDFMPYDQPLSIVKDPAFLLQTQIETLTARIKEAIGTHKISKRYLAEQLHTSDNQIQRLLNPKILNKNLGQLYQIGALVGLELEIRSKAA